MLQFRAGYAIKTLHLSSKHKSVQSEVPQHIIAQEVLSLT